MSTATKSNNRNKNITNIIIAEPIYLLLCSDMIYTLFIHNIDNNIIRFGGDYLKIMLMFILYTYVHTRNFTFT